MLFEVEHDWQASIATPRPKIGERAKTWLLLLLCALWLGFGLVGHAPWKPYEAPTASIIKHMLAGGSWVIPNISGQDHLTNPPLYYLSGTALAKLITPWLSIHDAARLATGLWMTLTLLFVGMTGRELWGTGSGRQTTFIFLGSIGLLISGHLLTPEIAGLCGYSAIFYGIALSRRRPYRAGSVLAAGLATSFLSVGLTPLMVFMATASFLFIFKPWRCKAYIVSLLIGLVIALPIIACWIYLAQLQSPDELKSWLTGGRHVLDNASLWYFIKTLTWYAWPGLPLALWTLWFARSKLLTTPSLQLSLLFFIATLLTLGFGAESRDIEALPLLLPIAAIASGGLIHLRRSYASLLDWFGVMVFGFAGFLIWLGWFAMMTGYPGKLSGRMHKLSLSYVPHINWLALILAVGISCAWALVVFKSKRSNRTAVTDWAVGITMVWVLLISLWLPWLDAAKNYIGVFQSMHSAMPKSYACMTSLHLGDAQRALLDYHQGIHPLAFENVQRLDCDLYLIQDERGRQPETPGAEWSLIWQGKRASDRRESFRLYQYHAVNAVK